MPLNIGGQRPRSSLGMIETKGLPGLIAASDAMSKAAAVEVLSTAKTGAGMTTVFVRGKVAACQAAVEAGAREAHRIGQLVAAHVIPAPAPQLKRCWAQIIEK